MDRVQERYVLHNVDWLFDFLIVAFDVNFCNEKLSIVSVDVFAEFAI